MKFKMIIIASIFFSLYLTGCARNNVNDNAANRNRDGITRVNYNPNNNGPLVNRPATDVRYNNPNVTDVRYNNRNVNNRTRMSVADDAADKVADLKDVDHVNIIVTDNNAYVAAKLANNAKLTNKLENKITDRVKSVDHDIDNVYISANPDFYDRMRTYSDEIRAGRPVSGFFDQFSQAIQRVFPDLKR